MKKTLHTLAAVAMIALVGAGGQTALAGTGSSGKTTITKRNQAVKFAECLRNQGIRDFPDPDANGDFSYGVSVTPAVFTKAVGACKDLEPPGALSTKRSPQEQKAALKFAQCMRDNGVKDFPDPVDGEPLVNTYRIPSSNRPGGMSILNAGMRKCSRVLNKAAGGQ